MDGYGYVKHIHKKLLTTKVYRTDVKGRKMNQALLERGGWSNKDVLCKVARLFFFKLLAEKNVHYLLVEISS